MKTSSKSRNEGKEIYTDRRSFISKGLFIASAAGVGGLGLLTGCGASEKEGKEEGEEKKVSPPEDLMQEHGVLKRILLIYDTCRNRLANKESFPVEAVSNSAKIIRSFVEDYHEKHEEQYIFPRFQKAGQLTGLVQTLLGQHKAGRAVTDQIMQLSKSSQRTASEDQRLIELLAAFNTMYNPHEAREDTVLFPAFRNIVSQNEYDSLGEQFEKDEHKLFGEDGFATVVNKVAEIEKTLNIYDLSQFTPKLG